MRISFGLLILVLSIFVFAGCATSRGYLKLEVPTTDLITQTGKQVLIRSIEDNREFQDYPPSPDIPSLGFGGVQQASKEMKSRAIARKRDLYGKALGDIFLEEGQTVETVIYGALKNALNANGYTVVNNKNEVKQDVIIMDVTIDKFWAWVNPGLWTIAIKAEITTSINVIIPNQVETKVIKASAINKALSGKTENWIKAYKMTIEDYINKAKDEFNNLNMQ